MIIGITGLMGSGKDLIGELINEILSEYNESKFQIKKYAGKLKEIAAILIGCNVSDFEDREFKEKELGEEWWYWVNYYEDDMNKYKAFSETILLAYVGNQNLKGDGYTLIKLTPRKLLQLLGTEAGRDIIHPNIWVNALFADYKKEMRTNANEETELFNYPKWIITDVRFPNEAKAIKDKGGIIIKVIRPDNETTFCEHLSENSLNRYVCDHTVVNDSTQKYLKDKIRQILIKENII